MRCNVTACAVITLLVSLYPGCSDDAVEEISAIGHENLLKACVASSACRVKSYPRISDCLEAYYSLHVRFGLGPIYDSIYQCVNDAKGDCKKVFSCYGSHQFAGSCDTTFTAKCDNDRALNCDSLSHRVFVFDCKTANLKCLTKTPASFEADCTTGKCSIGTARKCSGTRLLSCKTDGLLEIDDCSKRGLKCGKTAKGTTECIGNTDKTCNLTSMYKASCEGNSALYCINNQVHKEDCSKRPFKQKCKSGVCDFAGAECSDQFNRCKGDSLEYCNEGRWVVLDCTSLGLGKCVKAVNGADCSPPA